MRTFLVCCLICCLAVLIGSTALSFVGWKNVALLSGKYTLRCRDRGYSNEECIAKLEEILK